MSSYHLIKGYMSFLFLVRLGVRKQNKVGNHCLRMFFVCGTEFVISALRYLKLTHLSTLGSLYPAALDNETPQVKYVNKPYPLLSHIR
jgi:hypothetical protein